VRHAEFSSLSPLNRFKDERLRVNDIGSKSCTEGDASNG
jgi:hypothetical protein